MRDNSTKKWFSFLKENKEVKNNIKGASFVVFCGNRILLIRRTGTSEEGGGQLTAGPGGGYEERDNFENENHENGIAFNTALREAKEEINVDYLDNSPIDFFSEKSGDGTFTVFLIECLSEHTCSLDSKEHDAWAWINVDDVYQAIEKRKGRVISENFTDKDGKKIEVVGNIHGNTIRALKRFKKHVKG